MSLSLPQAPNPWLLAADILAPEDPPPHPYLGRPAAWIRDQLGEHVWSKQEEILQSVIDHQRTAAPSCYSAGKSWLAARLACYWIDVHPPGQAFVVTTAPTNPQVKAILWREMRRAHAAGRLGGRMNQLDWWIDVPGGQEEMVAFGRKPSDMSSADSDEGTSTVTAFQGIHARYVLVLIDEASGVPGPLFETADSALMTNDDSRLVAIGNPEDATSKFADACKPGSGWNVVRIPYFSTPNFTGEKIPKNLKHVLVSNNWIEDKKKRWGETNPLWIAKALAEFPEKTTDGLIPISWIRAAQDRWATTPDGEVNRISVDVGAGGNKSVVGHRRGYKFRIIRRDQNPDTMATCGNVVADRRTTKADDIVVDKIGVGQGICDRLEELGEPVVAINVSQPPHEEDDKKQYLNIRAQTWWRVRDLLQNDIAIDPDDEDLAAQLVDLRYKRTSSGKIQIESKLDMKSRGKASPDDADSLMLSFAEGKKRKKRATWGRGSKGKSGNTRARRARR